MQEEVQRLVEPEDVNDKKRQEAKEYVKSELKKHEKCKEYDKNGKKRIP